MVHTPFLKRYILGNSDNSNTSVLQEDISRVKAELENIKSEVLKSKKLTSYTSDLIVTNQNDQSHSITVDGTQINLMSGDAIINSINVIASNLSEISERVKRLENNESRKNNRT